MILNDIQYTESCDLIKSLGLIIIFRQFNQVAEAPTKAAATGSSTTYIGGGTGAALTGGTAAGAGGAAGTP